MPKTVPDYSLCRVYKLVSSQTDKVYIGSTCQKYLSSRLSQHKTDYKNFLKGKYGNVSSFEIVKYDDCKIVLIQSYPDCKNNMEQRMHEQDWIDIYDCVNKYKSYVSLEQRKERDCKSQKEWRKNNKEYIKECYEENKEYYQEYYEKNKEYKSMIIKCECGAEIRRDGLSKHITRQIHKKNIDLLKS